MEDFYARLQDDRPGAGITSPEEFEKRLRTDLFDFMKLYAQNYHAQEAPRIAKMVADAEDEKKRLIAQYEEHERMLKLRHETELVEAEKRGKEEALRQFNVLMKEIELTHQLRIDELNASHAQEIESLQSQMLAAVAQSIELRTAAVLQPTPAPSVAPRSATATYSSSSHTRASAVRSPVAASGPGTAAANTSNLTGHSATPTLRVVPVSTPPATTTTSELDERLHSLEEMLSQRKDLLLKRLHEQEMPSRPADSSVAQTPG